MLRNPSPLLRRKGDEMMQERGNATLPMLALQKMRRACGESPILNSFHFFFKDFAALVARGT
jgi:hypothetical protein